MRIVDGAIGNEHHRFFDVRQAEAVTATGQLIIRYVANAVNAYLNSEFGTNTDYVLASDTDSVAGDSVIVVNGESMTIAEYFDRVSGPYLREDEFNKQWVKRVDDDDYTPSVGADGSVVTRPIKYVMKHTVKKQMFRVTTPGGTVVVTADHSLMAYDTQTNTIVEITPADIDVKRHRLINVSAHQYIEKYTIECLGEQEETVYDIEVDDTHNFFANNVAVHNSIYVKLSPVVGNMSVAESVDYLDRYCETDLQRVIDTAFRTIVQVFNTPDNVLAMKREAIAEHGVWTAKKRYLLWVHDNEGVRYDPPKLKTVGIEAVRSSTPKYARQVIKKALEYFIRNDKDGFYALLDDAECGFMTRPFEDIASPRSCNGLREYPLLPSGQFTSGTPIQVRGSLVYNRHLEETGLDSRYPKIREGEKIRFCYLKPQNPLRCTVIAAPNTLPPEWKLEPFLDRLEQFEKTVVSPLDAVIAHAGWSVRPVTTLF